MQLRGKQQFLRDGFTLLEVVLSAVLLAITTLSTYTLFQVRIATSKLANDLDAADRELFGNMQEIRRLGASFNWCQGQASTDPANCTDLDAAGNKYTPLTQGYYQQNDATKNSIFYINCRIDAGAYAYNPEIRQYTYTIGADALLPVLWKKIEEVGVETKVYLVEKTTRRMLVVLKKSVPTEAFGSSRTVIRYLYLVPEVAKWCPS